MTETTIADSGSIAAEKRRSPLSEFFHRLVREKPLGLVGGVIVLLLLISGIFADLSWLGLPDIGIAPYGLNEVNPDDFIAGYSARHWLGADNLGRDVLSRVIYGARTSLQVGLYATALATVISLVLGLSSGFLGGKFDLIVQRFVDAWMCFPGLIVLIVAITLVGPGLWQMIFVLSLMGIGGSRSIRGPVIAIRNEVYVQSAIATGCSTWRVLMRHILPNVMAPTIVLFTTRMPGMIMSEASLSFLGFGIPPPAASWGGMLSGSGRFYMQLAPWMALWPGIALTVSVYGINVFGDAVRDLLDPRLRGGVGRYSSKKRDRRRQKVTADVKI
jgi:peptide/nickel transport system permease protein